MADDFEDEITDDLDDSESESGGKSKLIKLLPIAVVVLAVEVVLAYFIVNKIFFSNPPAAMAAYADSLNLAEGEANDYESTGEIFSFEDIIVNPAETLGRRFLAISLSFEVSDKKVITELPAKEAIIRDALISLLAAKPLDYVADVANMEVMRKEIMETVNRHLKEGKVIRTYYTGYVLQ